MAVLQKIREKSVLLVLAIGLSLFAFILGGLLEGGINFSSRNVGSVNGVSLPAQDFIVKLQNLEQSQQIPSGQANNYLWSQEVKYILLGEQFENSGIKLGKDQLIHVIQTHPNFAQNPQFLNELGQFDQNKFNLFLSQLKAQPDQWNSWLNYEKVLEQYGKEQLFFNLIKGGINTTNLEAKLAYQKEMNKAQIDFITLAYSTVKDEEAKVEDAEIESYIKNHAKDFKSENSRIVEYVFVANKASEQDKQEVKTQIEDLLKPTIVFNNQTQKNDSVAGFKNTKDVIGFVNSKSDLPFDSLYYAKDELPQTELKETLYNLPLNEVYGPYEYKNYYCLSKVISRKNVVQSVDASHILIAYKGAANAGANISLTKEEAKTKAEELLAKLQQTPDSFAQLAATNTDDPGSKNTGGKYEKISKGQMVPSFDAYIFNNPVNKLAIVESDFGFHILKVDKIDTKDGIQLATVAKVISSSEKTQDEVYSKATKFEEAAASKDFSKTATSLGLVAHPATKVGAFDDQLPAIEGSQSQAISWIYSKDASKGAVKKFDSAEGHLIVKLTDINNSGLMSVTEARPIVESILKNEKKAKILRDKMKGATLEEVAKTSGASIQNAEVNGANPVINFGYEPQVAGTAMALTSGKTSALIDGTLGVFMVRNKALTKAPELPNYKAYKLKLNATNLSGVEQYSYQALLNQADIEDNRTKVLR